MIITHESDPAEPAAISHVEPIKLAAHEAVKNTPLAGASFYLGGTASTYKDIGDMESYDLLIVTIASLSLILLIMMIITRSLVAAIVIVGTVALSWAHRSGCRCWCGSTSWASNCIGSYWLWRSSSYWPSDPTTTSY